MKICKTLLIFIVLITMVSFVNAIEQEPVTNTGKAVTETNTMMECLDQKGCGGPEEEIKKGGLQFALQEINPEDEECYKQCNVDITCYFKETDACWAQTGYQDNDQQLIQCSSQSTETCQITPQPTETLKEDKKAVTETNTMMECLQQKGCGGPEEEIKKGGLQFALQEISPEDEECYKQCNVDITCYFKETDACWAQTGYQDNDQQLIQCSSQSTENCAKNESFINRIINWLRNWFD